MSSNKRARTDANGTPSEQCQNIVVESRASSPLIGSPSPTLQLQEHSFDENSIPGEFYLNPYIAIYILRSYNLEPQDLANLEATCTYFRRPPDVSKPYFNMSIPELAALDMCKERAIFRSMTEEEEQVLKQKCGGSWKLVLKFLLTGESCHRREKSQAIAGPGFSIAVTSKGDVYSFGSNSSGELGHGNLEDDWRPRKISSLQGIRIIEAATGSGRTMLISDAGQVYACGKGLFGEKEFEILETDLNTTSQPVESLKNIFVVQASIGNYFIAVLSREGRVYTFSWGSDSRLGHRTDFIDQEPHALLGPLENIPVVQIAAGYCYLLALAFRPGGMSVYSVGCGLGGKLGHDSTLNEGYPKLIEHFQALNLQPMMVAAGCWHAAVVGRDGRVCTWGWDHDGCLGHGKLCFELVPRVVEALNNVKAVYVATGENTTFVLSEDGDVYSFGSADASSLGLTVEQEDRLLTDLKPTLVTLLKEKKEQVVQISPTNSLDWHAHTLVLTESGKLYSFGSGDRGQLGMEIDVSERSTRKNPEEVNISLS